MPVDGEPTLSVARLLQAKGADQLVGSTILERYDVIRKLGAGGFGTVYLAADRKLLAKQVVIKVLSNPVSDATWSRKKFKQEMEALSRIDHPGVVVPLDSGELNDGTPFLVMQYVDGKNLGDEIPPGGAAFLFAASVVRQVGAALTAAHAKGIIHRDLKPTNIVVQRTAGDDASLVRVIDFGIASVEGSKFGDGSDSSRIVGTPRYMAPEQLCGNPEAASDTYAMGVVAYELLTGRNPFADAGSTNLFTRQQEEAFPAPGLLRIGLPPAVEMLIRKSLSFAPRLRPASPREFGTELARLLEGAAGKHSGPEPRLGGLVARLCDRRAQEDDFRLFLQQHTVDDARTPLVVVVRGEEGECHQSLVDRFVYLTDRFVSQRNRDHRSGLVRKRIPWQYEGAFEQRRNRMLCRLHDEIASGGSLSDLSSAAFSTILERNPAAFLVVEHEIHMARWDCQAGPLLECYLDFWDRLSDRISGTRPLIFLSLITPRQRGSHLGQSWMGRWNPMALLRPAGIKRAGEELRQILAVRRRSCRLVLDELRPVVREDVLEWFSLNGIYDSEAVRLDKVRHMFASSSVRWPMAEVERQLTQIHEDFVRERGYR